MEWSSMKLYIKKSPFVLYGGQKTRMGLEQYEGT